MSPRAALPVLLFFLICLPAASLNDIGVTNITTYYPIAYGSHTMPTVSEKFELKSYRLSSTSFLEAALVVSSAPGFGVFNAAGGIMAFIGAGVELAPTGKAAMVNIGNNAYLYQFLVWVHSSALPAAADTSTTNLNPGGPYWVPICKGFSTAGGAICDFTATSPSYTLFMRTERLFGKLYSAAAAGCGLRLFTDQALTLPVATGSSGIGTCPGIQP